MNPFICDIIEGGFPISQIILSEKPAMELELLEMEEDWLLQMLHKASPMIEFWNLVPETKYSYLKKAASRLFYIFGATYCCHNEVREIETSFSADQSISYRILWIVLTNFTPNFKNLTKIFV